MSALFVAPNIFYLHKMWYIIGESGEPVFDSVAIIGGDKRQIYCAKAFLDDGMKVTLCGFDNLRSDCDIKIAAPIEGALYNDLIVLPLPCVKGNMINAPFSSEGIELDGVLLSALSDKKIFCGQKEKLLSIAPQLNSELIYDYSIREEFAIYNAVATAEGALEIAMREYEGTISHCRVLVCGYGRIGKVLCDMLISLNADVTVSARKQSDFAWISTRKCECVHTGDLVRLSPFDIIFNTVPSLVFDSFVLSHIAKDALVIDLASVPGGVDFEAASRMGISIVHALSLPGKAAPKTAGKIIKNTISNILEEDGRCQKLA